MADPPRRPPFAKNNTPSFFAIILDGAISRNKIRIPEKTVKRCGSSLKGEVVLKVPGSEWKMSLTTTMVEKIRHVYIDHGWVEFSKHFSIAKGHLLSLRYVGDSRFDVTIFDITTNEIHYPVKQQIESQTGNRSNPVLMVKQEDDDDSPSPYVRPSARFRSRKRKQKGEQAAGCVDESSDESGRSSARLNTKKTRRAQVSRASKGKLKGHFMSEKQAMRANDGHGHAESSKTNPQVTLEAMEQALMRAKSFVESKHQSFVKVLQSCDFGVPGYMSIPREFAESYLRLCKKVILIAPDKTKYPVNFSYKGGNHMPGFRKGWVVFPRENDLKVGDVCVFVLAKADETALFEVSLFYKNREPKTHSAKDSGTEQKSSPVEKQTENAVKEEDDGDSPSPYVHVRPLARSRPEKRKRRGVDEPSEESAGYVGGSESSEESGRSSARLNTKKTRRAPVSRASKGKLKEKQAMRASHGRAESSKTNPLVSLEATEEALMRAKSFVESRHKSFVKVLQLCDFGKPGYMSIPREFAESYLHLCKKVVLIAPDKTKYPVNFSYKGGNHKPGFRKGWVAFARGNELRVGEVCVFALAKADETALFEVSLFSKNEEPNTHFAKDSGKKPKSSQTGNPSSAEEKAREQNSVVVNEQSENPSFAVYIYSSYLNRCSCSRLRVPAGFAKEYLKTEPSKIHLRDSSGISRLVDYKVTRGKSGRPRDTRYLICKGWSDFRKKIGVEEGCICAFELTNQNDFSFYVRLVKQTHSDYKLLHTALGGKGTKPLDAIPGKDTETEPFKLTRPDYEQMHIARGPKLTKLVDGIPGKDPETEPFKPSHPDYEQIHAAQQTKPLDAVRGKDAETIPFKPTHLH